MKQRERGFSLLELAIVMLGITILVAVVALLMTGFFSSAREASLKADLRNMKTSVDIYISTSLPPQAPTEDGRLPLRGEYALLNFDASFTEDGEVLSFYPHFIDKLPRHWDEGVWRIDSVARVSVDMDPEEY